MTRSAFPHTNIASRQSRREMLMESAGGLGGIALASMLAGEKAHAGEQRVEVVHHPPRAKRVVQLFMSGAASHLDLYDFKPELVKRHGEPSDFGEHVEAFQNGLGPCIGSATRPDLAFHKP